MDIGKVVKKAMIDNDIKGAIELVNATGLSKEKCYRLMKGDKTLRLKDVVAALSALDVKIKFISLGEE